MREWKLCLACGSMDAERICPSCLGCDNCCKCPTSGMVHRQSAEGALLRRKARLGYEEKQAKRRQAPGNIQAPPPPEKPSERSVHLGEGSEHDPE